MKVQAKKVNYMKEMIMIGRQQNKFVGLQCLSFVNQCCVLKENNVECIFTFSFKYLDKAVFGATC